MAQAAARRSAPVLIRKADAYRRRARAAVTIERCSSVDQPGWLPLRAALWPYCSRVEHRREMASFIAEPRRYVHFVAYASSAEPVGLIEASIRSDYVNGTERSPVAFVEGLYVVPSHRRRRIAARLIAAVVAWATHRGCRELASDAAIDNHVSHAVHEALGFRETERVVFFTKKLHRRPAATSSRKNTRTRIR